MKAVGRWVCPKRVYGSVITSSNLTQFWKISALKTLKQPRVKRGIMKHFHGKICPLLVMTLILTGLVVQGVEAHSCGSTFFSALVQLIPCRASVAPFSPIPPSDACCNAIKALGQSCLCILVNGPPISGVDRSMALQLPDKCSTNFEPCELVRK